MEDLLNDDELKKEFGTEWEQDLLNNIEKSEKDFVTETADELDKNSPEPKHLEVLFKCFGHKKFRPMQWKIINSIINERRDNCAIMATGYGKSLCFQYPSVYKGGITIVVSPLISLMEDQILAMKVANIPACLLGSANTKQKQTIKEIFEEKYTLVYLTPEFCTGDYGRDLLKDMYQKLSIILVAIDEAHCTSTWGHDFRFQYRKLDIIKKIMPNTPILAVTATATPNVRDDIIKLLKLKNPQILCTGFDRPNLYFSVYLKDKDPLSDFRRVMVRENGEWKFIGSTIIYCITRKHTEQISLILSDTGIKCLPYHAGLTLKVRKDTHEKFVKDKLDVIVATIAFGMGIDKPDIRNVIHYGASNSIEGYYQEVGRAGRDGLPAKCIGFYSNADFVTHRRLREQLQGSAENITSKEKMADLMLEYLSSRNCRRQFILSYFGDSKVTTPKDSLCCDNCIRKNVQPDNEVFEGVDKEGKYDFTEDARIFLKAVHALRGKFGISMYVLFLRGSRSSKMSSYLNNNLHGSGKHKKETWWKGIGNLLDKEKYLEKKKNSNRSGFDFYTVHVSQKGIKFLESRDKLITTPLPELITCLKTKSNAWLESGVVENQQRTLLESGVVENQQQSWLESGVVENQQRTWLGSKVDNNQYEKPSTSSFIRPKKNVEQNDKESSIKLYKLLMGKRSEIATSLDCMPYSIASNATLMDMAIQKPTTLQELKNCQLNGFTEAKISKFGQEFLKTIRSHLEINFDVTQTKLSIRDILVKYPLARITGTAQVTYSHFKSGLTVEEIGKKRCLVPTTIISHLADCIKYGFPIKLIQLGVTAEIKETIINAIKTVETGMSLLTPIKNACPPDVTISHVRIVVNYLQVRQHLKRLNIPYEEFEDIQGNENDLVLANKNTNEEDLSQPESVDKLTQLLNAIEEVKQISAEKGEDFFDTNNENTNFSEGFGDTNLAAACEVMETNLNEDDDTEPLPKKFKTEELFAFSVLDSPPRNSHSPNTLMKMESVLSNSKSDEDHSKNDQVVLSCSQHNESQESKPNSSKNKKDPLPPWLMLKRIA